MLIMTPCYGLQLVTFVYLARSATAVLPFYSLHVTGCDGRPISTDTYAGELTFSADDVHREFESTTRCDMMITPKSLGYATRVMFYFTEFNIGTQCTNNNVTVYNTRDSTYITGLGQTLCGHNKSLENPRTIFTSTGNGLRILYRWNSRGSGVTGSFKLVFVSFYEGPCKTEDGYFSCSTNRCISSDISCRDDVNYCGNGEEPGCNVFGTENHVLRSLMNMARNIILLAAIVVVLSLIKKVLYTRLKEKHGSVLNFPLVRQVFGHSNNSHNDSTRRRTSAEEVNVTERQNTIMPEVERVPLTFYDSRGLPINNTNDVIMAPPSYEEVVRTNGSPAVYPAQTNDLNPPLPASASHTLPPPAYDDVVTDGGKYVK